MCRHHHHMALSRDGWQGRSAFTLTRRACCCRGLLGFQAGRTQALLNSAYGTVITFGLTNIDCRDAERFSECKTSGWMETACEPTESAVVRCDQPGENAFCAIRG